MDLYHLYSLFRMIYEEVAHSFSNAKVDLYYNEGNSEHLALTVKFAADMSLLNLLSIVRRCIKVS